MYIVFEGIDGAGKTIQASMLCDKLIKLFYTGIPLAEPTYGKYGLKIRELVAKGTKTTPAQQHELFTLDRRDHVKRKIKPLLEFTRNNPTFLIVQDRYYLSAPAYQAESEEEARMMLGEQQAFAPKPDIVFLLDVPTDVAMARLEKTRKSPQLFENIKTLEKVRDRYLLLAQEDSERIEVVDGTRPPAEICENILGNLSLERLAD